jgi:hypothetical protein
MTNLTSYFSTPFSYKANFNGGYLGGCKPKGGNSHGNDNSGYLGGGNPKGDNSHGNDNSGYLGGGNPKGDNSHGNDNSGYLGGGNPKGGNSHGDDNSGYLGGGNPKGGDSHGDDNSAYLGGGNPKGGDSHGGNPNGNQPFGNQVITGTSGNDTLQGNRHGIDTLVGTTEVARGVGERDILIGGCARDTFVLGDAKGSFYLGNGSNDYAEIKNFNRSNDNIQLTGSIQDYSISYAAGISSVFHKDACGCLDLVAQVNSACSPLDLNGNYFQFTPSNDSNPILMG